MSGWHHCAAAKSCSLTLPNRATASATSYRPAYQTAGVPPHRDVAAFGNRAPSYEQGWRGRLHHDIAGRAAELALPVHATPQRVLDVGCGTGYPLRLLAGGARRQQLAGTDPAPSMIEAAEQAADDQRLPFTVGTAEWLPYPNHAFDLVISTTSFDHWADQRTGLGECARVLTPRGHLVIADLFSVLLLPTLLAGRSAKARTRRRASQLLSAAGFQDLGLARPVHHHHQGRDGNDPTHPGTPAKNQRASHLTPRDRSRLEHNDPRAAVRRSCANW